MTEHLVRANPNPTVAAIDAMVSEIEMCRNILRLKNRQPLTGTPVPEATWREWSHGVEQVFTRLIDHCVQVHHLAEQYQSGTRSDGKPRGSGVQKLTIQRNAPLPDYTDLGYNPYARYGNRLVRGEQHD